MLDPLYKAAVSEGNDTPASDHVGASVGDEATSDDWQTLLRWLPALRISEGARARLKASLTRIVASQTVLEPLADGRWRIGQGGSCSVYSRVPSALAIAYESLQSGEAAVPDASDNAVRMALRRAADWIERMARAPILARQLRALEVTRDGSRARVCAAHASATAAGPRR